MAFAFVRSWAGATRNKFHARRTTIDGETFDSIREARRWIELRELEKAGLIAGLRRQAKFPLHAASENWDASIVGQYVADFVYYELPEKGAPVQWPYVVEDVKGVRTELYRWKKRHLALEYGLTIRET